MTKKDQHLIWEAYHQQELPFNSNLQSYIEKENNTYRRTTGVNPPSPDEYPLSKQVSDDPLVQQYVATRLHYYGGGKDKLKAAQMWKNEALMAPRPLD